MPKLYYSLQRTSDPALADPWQVPGVQDKKAERVDVPGSPAELAAWLNARRVPLKGDAFDGLVPCNAPARELLEELRTGDAGERPWIKGPPTRDPPRVSPAFLGALDGGEEFIPVSKAAEIDRALHRCPKCHGGGLANVVLWIGEASVDELQGAAEAIKARIAGVADELAERSVQ